MNSLELKIPPVVVALCTASLMWVVARFLLVGDAQLTARIFFAVICTAVGVVTSGLGVMAFRRSAFADTVHDHATVGAVRKSGPAYRLQKSGDLPAGNYRRQCAHPELCCLVGASHSGTVWDD